MRKLFGGFLLTGAAIIFWNGGWIMGFIVLFAGLITFSNLQGSGGTGDDSHSWASRTSSDDDDSSGDESNEDNGSDCASSDTSSSDSSCSSSDSGSSDSSSSSD